MSQVILQNKIQKDYSAFKAIVDDTLTEVTANMLDGIREISSHAFYTCANLTSVEIPTSVSYIRDYAFASCNVLQNISLTNGLVFIGQNAFYNAGNMIQPQNFNVIIPNSVTIIGQSAFSYSRINSINLSNQMTEIRDSTFYGCSLLTSINIPNNIITIGNNVFTSSKLSNVIIGNGVTSIGNTSFAGCTSLTSVTIQAISPPTLGSSVFSGTSQNLVIYVPSESVETYKSASGWSTHASKIQPIPT